MAPPERTQKISRADKMHVSPHAPKGTFGWRHLQVFMIFLGFASAYALRVNMSVAIVSMVDAESSNPDFEEFDWDESAQSLILSSFFWGYVVSQIPAGIVIRKVGAKRLWTISAIISGLMTILTPLVAHNWGAIAVCVTRCIIGFCQGIVVPCINTLLSKWAPPMERGRFVSYAYAGSQFGTVLMLSTAGFLAASSWGWPSDFYVPGAVMIVWAFFWYFLTAEDPDSHKWISWVEKEYIEASLGVIEVKEELNVPWGSIVKSGPFWALFVTNCCQAWGFFTLLTETPTYLSTVMDYDIESNGLLAALPYLVMWLLTFPFSFSSDYLIKKGCISTKTSRRIFNSIGFWVSAGALVGLGFVGKDSPILAEVILVIAVGSFSAYYCGWHSNHLDLSPNFAGVLIGLTNGCAQFMSILGPLVAGAIVTETGNSSQWRIVFLISAAIMFTGNLVFILFLSTDIQWWNEPPSTRRDLETPEASGSSKDHKKEKY